MHAVVLYMYSRLMSTPNHSFLPSRSLDHPKLLSNPLPLSPGHTHQPITASLLFPPSSPPGALGPISGSSRSPRSRSHSGFLSLPRHIAQTKRKTNFPPTGPQFALCWHHVLNFPPHLISLNHTNFIYGYVKYSYNFHSCYVMFTVWYV